MPSYETNRPSSVRIDPVLTRFARCRSSLEQKLEWNVSICVNFIDHEKAFDSVDRDTVWPITKHYGVHDEFISLIKATYRGMPCRVLNGAQLSKVRSDHGCPPRISTIPVSLSTSD